MKIMALDIATNTGWAVLDDERPPSAIISASFKLQGATPFDRVRHMRSHLPKLIKQYRPDFVAIEAPMEIAPRYKKVKKTMFGEEEQETTINSKTIAILNRYAGAAEMAVMGNNIPCIEVAAKTWQTIIPKNIPGKPKERVKAYCEMLRIDSPNMDSRDACIIALWAAGHCQELKLMQRATEAA